MTKRQIMLANIEKHGANLNAIFNTKFDNTILAKKLFRLENKAHHATTCLCNTNTLNLLELNRFTGYDVEQASEEEQDKFFDKIRANVVKILGESVNDVLLINFDPRGYALKLKTDFCKNKAIYQDMGGFGILAPNFN
jgi:hypothetical protein